MNLILALLCSGMGWAAPVGDASEQAAQLKRVKRMFWRPTQRGQGPNQIVTLFLRRIPGVKPADRTGGAWKFWQKAYPSKFTVKQARTPKGARVIVFYPVGQDGDEEEEQGIVFRAPEVRRGVWSLQEPCVRVATKTLSGL